ncbi:MAG TPA: hypothetical protein VF406_10095 [Thermodesulfobacteriota bacterium]
MARRDEHLKRQERERVASQDELERLPPGAASGPDPAAGGGPHASVPRGDHPTWRPQNERAERRGFLRAALIVLGVIAAVWLIGYAFNLWVSAERDEPMPGATRGGGAGYTEPQPGRVTPGGPASANPDPRNPVQPNPNTMDRGQQTGAAPPAPGTPR